MRVDLITVVARLTRRPDSALEAGQAIDTAERRKAVVGHWRPMLIGADRGPSERLSARASRHASVGVVTLGRDGLRARAGAPRGPARRRAMNLPTCVCNGHQAFNLLGKRARRARHEIGSFAYVDCLSGEDSVRHSPGSPGHRDTRPSAARPGFAARGRHRGRKPRPKERAQRNALESPHWCRCLRRPFEGPGRDRRPPRASARAGAGRPHSGGR